MFRPHPRAYAMIVMVVITTILAVLSIVVVNTAVDARDASRQTYLAAEARNTAQATIDTVYGRVLADDSLLDYKLSASPPPSWNLSANTGSVTFNSWSTWTDLASMTSGSTQGETNCAAVRSNQSCLRIRFSSGDVQTNQASLKTGVQKVNTAVMDVVVRNGCATGKESTCSYTRFQQRLRKQQFFDFLFYTQYSSLDPNRYEDLRSVGTLVPAQSVVNSSCADKYATARDGSSGRVNDCIVVSYQGDSGNGSARDVIEGPVYTNDDYLAVCGNPLFRAEVLVHGASAFGQPPSSTCSPNVTADVAPRTNQPTLTLPTSFNGYTQASVDERAVTISGNPARVVFETNGTYSVNGTNQGAVPDAGRVIVATGNVEVSGQVSGRVSLFAGGNITIVNDITYRNGGNSANTEDVLLLNAQGSIRINQVNRELTVQAVMVSLQNAVYVDNWAVGQGSTFAKPKLNLYGAMAAKYQGIFGSYSVTDKLLTSGYQKAFTFDSRLKDGTITAPALLEPREAVWQRLDMSEVAPCTGSFTACA